MDLLKKIKNYTYNQRHCLGEGSFGRVYEGRSQEGFRVAIKKVEQRTISKDQYLRASLQTEISIMKKLNHPNIVKLYDIVMTVNHIYLIMQFCGGGDLKRYCRNRKLPQQEANEIIKQICKGFQEIVKHGIIHRDLKPANILVHEGVFKICDFGFAKFFTDTTRMARTCVGTPIYMSPQVLHQKSYTNKTDIWSLGVLFYELLFAKLPYYGSSEEQLYRAIVKTTLQIPACSKSTALLLKNMLEADENKRFNWNQLFEHYKLGQLEQDHRRDIFPPSLPQEQPKPQIQNQFYREKEPSSYEVLPPPPIKNNYIQSEVQNNIGILNDSPNKRADRNYLREDFSGEKDSRNQEKKNIPQRKPKNPLAFQNMPPTNNNNMMRSVNKAEENQQKNTSGQTQQNPRFYYFILVQLIVNSIENCENYPKFISALYSQTINLYQQAIQKNKSSLYRKILMSEFQEIKSLQSDIPKFKSSSLKQEAEALVFEISQKNRTKQNLKAMKWIQKLLIRDYTYLNRSS